MELPSLPRSRSCKEVKGRTPDRYFVYESGRNALRSHPDSTYLSSPRDTLVSLPLSLRRVCDGIRLSRVTTRSPSGSPDQTCSGVLQNSQSSVTGGDDHTRVRYDRYDSRSSSTVKRRERTLETGRVPGRTGTREKEERTSMLW